ncbi:hypothetical protein Moror_16782 [Moniliophthora roreri MCA 2997]|nr:hypothetical protein Moror_16782 [Moniliophthora roreri MCA 2997]
MCNVLFRLLCTHPSLTPTIPGPMAFIKTADGPKSDDLDPGPYRTNEAYRSSFDQLGMSIRKIEETGSIPLTMEHPQLIIPRGIVNKDSKYPRPYPHAIQVLDHMLDVQGDTTNLPVQQLSGKANPTIFPDRFLFSITSPIITIRHPAHMLPSYVRGMSTLGVSFDSDFFLHELEAVSRYRWERLIFNCFSGAGRKPIVIDGGNLLEDPKGQMKKLCEGLGIDESKIEYTWNLGDDRKDGLYSHVPEPLLKAFAGTLHQSTGVIGRPVGDKPLDLAIEERKWADEWNDDLARRMSELVKLSMPDYEHLSQFSI